MIAVVDLDSAGIRCRFVFKIGAMRPCTQDLDGDARFILSSDQLAEKIRRV